MHFLLSLRIARRLAASLALALMFGLGSGVSLASAQSPSSEYQRLLAREKATRGSSVQSVGTLRSIAAGYENIVRKYPTSGYADNALWQAAGLLQLAFERSGSPRDRERATHLLTMIGEQYPSSSLAAQATARLRTLTARKAPSKALPQAGSPAQPPPLARPSAPVATAMSQPSPAPWPGGGRVEAPAPSTAPVTSVERAPATEALIQVRSIMYSKLPKGDRLVVELNQETTFSSSRTTRPDQLQLTFAGSSAGMPVVTAAAAIRSPLIQAVRVMPRATGALHVTLDLSGSPKFSTFPLYDPYRLVIDLESEAPQPASVRSMPGPLLTAPASAIGSSAPGPGPVGGRSSVHDLTVPQGAVIALSKPAAAAAANTSDGGYSLARQLGLGVSRIVIDPGHGGHDPGAQANGVSEAELVLDVALRAQKLLKDQPGFEVVLTRTSDRFVALEERTALANRETADLFLSIHANASPHEETRGIETYFLSFATNPQAEAVAARENASTVQTMRILPEIVKAIALNNKLAESRELASMVQTSLLRRLKVQNLNARDLGVKQAPFVVLIGAQMPSVLAEISFLTNPAEASLLKQSAYRQRIAQALVDAVLKYQASLKKVTTIAARTEGR